MPSSAGSLEILKKKDGRFQSSWDSKGRWKLESTSLKWSDIGLGCYVQTA